MRNGPSENLVETTGTIVGRQFSSLHPALWRWHWRRTWKGMLASSLVLVIFAWVFIWAMSLLKATAMAEIVEILPEFIKRSFGEDLYLYTTKAGQVSIVFRHLVTLLVCLGWALAKGSDCVSGEISRGTMEHLLVLPLRRGTLLLVPTVLATIGAAVLALSVWVGLALGLGTVERFSDLSAWQFVPGAINLFCLTFAMGGLTTLLSSMDHDRWRPIWLATGIFIVESIIAMVAYVWPSGWWLHWLTFLSVFEPQRLILKPEAVWTLPLGPFGGISWPLAVWYNSVLLLLGFIWYTAAWWIFVRRDIPVAQ
ncbi:MAG: ABC transporter permease [Thermoguttaceae bacterium]|nr:ABC transporter permease [Thermoguttaceae bacterium]MDW8036514.1 ABC transporter permease subunit [Thermoguttaceae bacterium]